jgi:hypothetical protein
LFTVVPGFFTKSFEDDPNVNLTGLSINTPAAAYAHLDAVSVEKIRELVHQTVANPVAKHPARIGTARNLGISHPHATIPHLHLAKVIFLCKRSGSFG